MNRITLGKTGLVIEKNGFGCLPIQRISEQDAVKLLHKAYDGGIDFFDTARAYSDSEQKVGAAFSAMRDKIVLATKTGAQTARNSGRISKRACARSRPIISISISSTTRPSARSRAGRTAFTMRRLRRRSRARSATSPSRTTALPWRTRPSTRGFTRPCSSRSATLPASRRWNLSENAVRSRWALSP